MPKFCFEKLSKDDRMLIARVEDMIKLCGHRHAPCFTDFLDERQCALLKSFLKVNGLKNGESADIYIGAQPVKAFFYGGYDNSIRNILCIHEDYFPPEKDDFPIDYISFKYRETDSLSHRDFLGATMALNIKRETIGDILISCGLSQMIVSSKISAVILNEISKVGSVGVEVSLDEQIYVNPEQKFIQKNTTVSSLRLDAVISAALNLSREKSLQFIKTDRVELNYFPMEKPSELLNENDIFTVRGFGKFILSEIGAQSKRGRIHITINQYK